MWFLIEKMFKQDLLQQHVEVTKRFFSTFMGVGFCYIPPLTPQSPKSDQHQISPCNINALLNRVVMRITGMITQDEFA